jgi:hypothetical protein
VIDGGLLVGAVLGGVLVGFGSRGDVGDGAGTARVVGGLDGGVDVGGPGGIVVALEAEGALEVDNGAEVDGVDDGEPLHPARTTTPATARSHQRGLRVLDLLDDALPERWRTADHRGSPASISAPLCFHMTVLRCGPAPDDASSSRLRPGGTGRQGQRSSKGTSREQALERAGPWTPVGPTEPRDGVSSVRDGVRPIEGVRGRESECHERP